MASATIKLFLIHGDPKRLRTAEISNWSGKAVAAPRTEFDEFLARDELAQSGVYILTGADALSGEPHAYVGEAEVLRDRLKIHKSLDFWVQATAFVSKDENLTKSHIRYLEGRLIGHAQFAGRTKLTNAQASGAKLPESDREDMEVFLTKVHQLLPVLGSDILTPVVQPKTPGQKSVLLYCEIKGLRATGERTPDGFVVFTGSQAVPTLRASVEKYPYLGALREKLLKEGTLQPNGSALVFTKDVQFSSPSAAAVVIHGGSANGLIAWRTQNGTTLKELEGSAT
ncbi:GIY-YIG nuclease family protein [soil metagenome]|jgi:hypothetical protein|nr:GIY-YIG nuclease family protein [Gemmatimonadota bacterium]